MFELKFCPGVGWLDPVVALFLVFSGHSMLFSIMAVPIYILNDSLGGFSFFHTLPSIYC